MAKDRFEDDKNKTLGWMRKNAMWSDKARTRDLILPFIQIPDRYFREIASELIKEGHLCSHNKRGYWAIDISMVGLTEGQIRRELAAIKESYAERKSKAFAMLEMINKLDSEIDDIAAKFLQGQQVFLGV